MADTDAEDVDEAAGGHRPPVPRGEGPGPVTPDGCSVALHPAIGPPDEPEVVAGAVLPGSTVPELDAGAGRITRLLLDRGYQVVAVDESREMLDRPRQDRGPAPGAEVRRAAGPATFELVAWTGRRPR